MNTTCVTHLRDAMITARVKIKIRELIKDKKLHAMFHPRVETTDGVVNMYGKIDDTHDLETVTGALYRLGDIKQVNYMEKYHAKQ